LSGGLIEITFQFIWHFPITLESILTGVHLTGDAHDVVVTELAAARNGAVAGDVRHRSWGWSTRLHHAELVPTVHGHRGYRYALAPAPAYKTLIIQLSTCLDVNHIYFSFQDL
jgi:hypothetical protein